MHHIENTLQGGHKQETATASRNTQKPWAHGATLTQPFWQALAQCPMTECTFEQRCQSSMWPLHQANLPQCLSLHKTAHQPDITHACSPDIIATTDGAPAALPLERYGVML